MNNMIITNSNKKVDQSDQVTQAVKTETEPVTCGNGPFLKKESKEMDLVNHIATAEQTNEKLQLKLTEQEIKFKAQERKFKEHELKLNELRKARLVDRAIYTQYESNVLLPKNLELRRELKKQVEENENLRLHLNDQKNKLDKMKRTMWHHMNYIKNSYLLYLTTFQNKCNRMILELDDLKKFTSVDTVPSLTEVEYYLFMWRKSLNFANNKHAVMLNFYNQITQNFASTEGPIAIPRLTLMPEPPTGFFSYFKDYIVHVKRLEQDLNTHMTYYYSGSRMPYTQIFTNSNLPEIKNEDLNLELEKFIINQGWNEQEDATTTYSNIASSFQDAMGAEMNSMVQENLKRRENEANDEKIPEYTQMILNTKLPELKNEDLNLERDKIIVNQECNEQEDAKTTHSNIASPFQDSMGAELNTLVQENLKTRENKANEEKKPENSTLLPAPAKPVVGSDGLLRKLIQKCPRTPVHILQEAVRLLREDRGSLSGLDSKTLLTDLKKIIINLAKKEKEKKSGTPSGTQGRTETSSSWTPIIPINKEVQQWYQRNSVGMCTICHNGMMSHNSTELMCRHSFHIPCIKLWFLKNMICPTCISLQ